TPPQPDPERRPVAPLLGHRGRSERAAGEPVRTDPAPGPSARGRVRAVGVRVGRNLHRAGRDALRVPARTRGLLAARAGRARREQRACAVCTLLGVRRPEPQGPSMPPAANARGFLLPSRSPEGDAAIVPRASSPRERVRARYATVERRPDSRERTMSQSTIAAAALAATRPAATRVLGCAAVWTIR